ncbi:Hypothetical predicted protein [Xyrichtys novacula]|uniref:Uncharacterized protein n=1 Tax=Xyrichtys novacula TaxID=13765 RepID=A0AAV1GXU1_XYRNO|nr:Hypothetical predicted protein [Xyrichtys novacula]
MADLDEEGTLPNAATAAAQTITLSMTGEREQMNENQSASVCTGMITVDLFP